MSGHRFTGEIERLRTPERVARVEVGRVAELCLSGLQARSMLDVGTGTGVLL